jgi:response regulator RpfG family c-di-GMP phosphodiesterase
VDDEPALLQMLVRVAELWGFVPQPASSAEAGLRVQAERPAPIVLTDLRMPGRGGVWLAKEVRQRWPETVVLVLTGEHDTDLAIECLNAGAQRYLSKPPCLHDLRTALNVAAELVRLRRERAQYQEHLEATVSRQTRRIRRLYLSGIESLVLALEARDPYTAGHSQRVRRYAVALGRRLGLPLPELRRLSLAAKLHDVGKVGVPEAILNKPDRLTPAEQQLIQRHPVLGEEILRPIIRSRAVLAAIRGHHERLDGLGYPDGLAGAHIPRLARLISVVDCFDALTSARPYREALPLGEAAELMRAAAGDQLEPEYVETWLEIWTGKAELVGH